MNRRSYKRVLTIAGSDSGGGAGIQADIKAISACGGYAASAITALTVQNTLGVSAIHIPPTEIVIGQIIAVIEDIGVDAIKIGMLPTAEIVCTLADIIERYELTNVVLDPVMVASSGDELIDKSAANAIVERLMPLVTLITPNIPEIEYITKSTINSEADFASAAMHISNLGARNTLLKAGHLKESTTLTDYLYCKDGQIHKYSFEKIDTLNTHGTGCTLSASIATYLAHEHPLPKAVSLAEDYLHKAILCGSDYTIGHGHGPVNHFWRESY